VIHRLEAHLIWSLSGVTWLSLLDYSAELGVTWLSLLDYSAELGVTWLSLALLG
jgi:hypothetical protein